MKLSTLTYFVEVARELSFTKAAEKLYVSQPTLSRHVQELESELGVSLFQRQSHDLQLTADGAKLLVAAADVLERVEHLSRMFSDSSTEQTTQKIFRIGYLSHFNLARLYEVLSRFESDHLGMQFLLSADGPLGLAEGLGDGHYDLIVDIASYLQDQPAFQKGLFMENHLQIAIPEGNPLAAQKTINFADLKNETLILFERQQSPIIVDYVINQGLQNGFNLRANHYVTNLEEGLSMAAMGKGLPFLYSGMNDQTLEKKYHIKIADLQDDSLDQNILVAINQQRTSELLSQLPVIWDVTAIEKANLFGMRPSCHGKD